VFETESVKVAVVSKQAKQSKAELRAQAIELGKDLYIFYWA